MAGIGSKHLKKIGVAITMKNHFDGFGGFKRVNHIEKQNIKNINSR